MPAPNHSRTTASGSPIQGGKPNQVTIELVYSLIDCWAPPNVLKPRSSRRKQSECNNFILLYKPSNRLSLTLGRLIANQMVYSNVVSDLIMFINRMVVAPFGLSCVYIARIDMRARSRGSRRTSPPQSSAPTMTGKTISNRPALTRTCVATAPPR